MDATEPADGDDVVKEMYDGEYPRVDIVAGPASGMRFVVLKAGDPTQTPADAITALGGAPMPDQPTVAPVAKAEDLDEPLPDADELMDDATAGAAGSEDPTDSPGDPDDPESPAWEAVDAARARQAVNMVLALQRLVQMGLDRESQEVAVGADGDDSENAFDLSCVLDALDCVLDTLAPFAVSEQAEADDREAQVVTKAGRILSGTNEGLIRSAVDNLTKVLATLPAAEPEGAPVAKSEQSTDPTAPAGVEGDVEKADKPQMVAVFSQSGKLLGAIDPADLTPLSVDTDDDSDSDDAPAGDDQAAPADDTAAAAPAAPADGADAPAAAPAEAAPAPAADDETVAKSTSPDQTEVLKSILADAVKAALQPLEDRVAKMEATPAVGGPLLSGATGQLFLRGQNNGAGDPEIEQVRKAMEAATNPVEKADLNRQLVLMQLRAMHSPS